MKAHGQDISVVRQSRVWQDSAIRVAFYPVILSAVGQFLRVAFQNCPIKNMDFFSARLLFAILVDDGKSRKKNSYDESVIVFRARDYDHAFERALELGKGKETNYKNHKDQMVRWALVEIVNLDWVGSKIDGCEVASNLHYRVSRDPIPPKRKFKPEKSKPEGSF